MGTVVKMLIWWPKKNKFKKLSTKCQMKVKCCFEQNAMSEFFCSLFIQFFACCWLCQLLKSADIHFCINMPRWLTLNRPSEIIFNPSIAGKYCLGIAEQIMDIIERCPIDTRKALLSNIFLIGGNCSIRGFASRLRHELNKLAWEGVRGNIKIDAHDTETAMYP